MRLQYVLCDLVSELQCGGFPGRKLQERVLIANELIDTRIREKNQGCYTEALTRCILEAQHNLVQGFSIKTNGDMVPVLQYADYILVLLDADLEMVRNLRGVMSWFKLASGLQVSTVKTKVYKLNDVDWE